MTSSTSRLSLPAKKVLIEALMEARPAAAPTAETSDLQVWRVGTTTPFSVVWIQGRIINVTDNRAFMLNDDTGVASIVSSAQAMCPDLKKDKYVMVVGELLKVTDRQPSIKPIKIQDLSMDTSAAKTWPLEVRDLENFLANHT